MDVCVCVCYPFSTSTSQQTMTDSAFLFSHISKSFDDV